MFLEGAFWGMQARKTLLHMAQCGQCWAVVVHEMLPWTAAQATACIIDRSLDAPLFVNFLV